jgi:serine/threonine protein kinase
VDFDGGRYKKNSDLWSLGCVIYYVATKVEVPFLTQHERGNARHRSDFLRPANVHDTHPLLFDLIDVMTQADPEARIILEIALTWRSECVGTFLCDLANAFNQDTARRFQHAINADARLIVPNADWMVRLPPLWDDHINSAVAKRLKAAPLDRSLTTTRPSSPR